MPADLPPGRTVGPVTKQSLRARVLARRATRAEPSRTADDEARTRRVLDLVDARWPTASAVIACYLSRAPEPGTLVLVDALRSRGHRILAPVLGRRAGAGTPRPVAWAWYEGPTRTAPGLWGIPEPMGTALGAAALHGADLVIASALAAGRDGTRLGTGGGWFDRALTELPARVPVWVLLNDDELFGTLPQEIHDHRVDVLITATATHTIPDC